MDKINENPRKLNIIHALLSGICVLIMFFAVLVIMRITPFGDKTFLMFDLKRQYVDFYAYAKTILRGNNNIFYSFSTTLGSGLIGFTAYYLTSPFLLLLSFCPRTLMPLGISAVIGMKLVLGAVIMDLFLQRMIMKEPLSSLWSAKSFGLAACSVSWAFSGFLFAHSMNLMWTDVIIMLPLLMWALEHLLDRNRRAPYIIILTVMLCINYYITFQILIFTALWTLMRIFVRKEEKPFNQILRVVFSTFTAPCIGAAILVPTALELANSPKDITQLGLTLTGSDLTVRDVFSKLPSFSYDHLEPRFGYPQLFCGILMIILTILYFMSRKRSIRERIGMLAMFGIMLVSFCKDVINLIWHAGMEPSGHPYRQAFLWVFMMVFCSAHVIADAAEMPEPGEDRRKLTVTQLIKLAGAAGLTAFLFYEVIRPEYDHVSDYTLRVSAAFLIAYAVLLTVLILLREKRTLTAVLAAAVLFLNMTDLTANACWTYDFQSALSDKRSDYSAVIGKTLNAVDAVNAQDGSFFRMDNLNPRQQNDPMQYGYNGITHYSSSGMTYVRYFLQRMGFNEDGLYAQYGHDNTASADTLLGVKYVLSDTTYPAHHDYDLFVDGEEKVYRNPWAAGIATGVNDFDLTGISSDYNAVSSNSMEHVPTTDPFVLQEDMFRRLTGTDTRVFVDADVSQSDITWEEDKRYIEYEVVPEKTGELYFYMNGLLGMVESLSLYVNGEFATTYGNAACLKIINLGYMESGDELVVRIYSENEDEIFGEARFVTEDTEALAAVSSILSDNALEIEKISSSHLRFTASDHNGVFLTIPCEKGWRFTVDGIKVQPLAVYDSLTYLPIDDRADTHAIEMTFVPDGFYAGLAASVLGAAVLIFTILMECGYLRKKRGAGEEQCTE